ncbi:hypothetical protein PAF17_08365 [Paracoccus sp. Z330]|uniref:Uncharacterized protein n=1 Tax=Paracoccus onchidii TaxID=3017813 RepID=A0ABT4ZFS8_9RHOB|nr:hypothetical protein [Paracoccus onchidii]MDB6177525.1 hypothetical protein [Paracoccus onchidii]
MRLQDLAVAASPGLMLILTTLPIAAQTDAGRNSLLAAPAAQDQVTSGETLRVGDHVDIGSIHLVRHPGRYGLGLPPSGSVFAVANDFLLRIDPDTGQILSILRDVSTLVD